MAVRHVWEWLHADAQRRGALLVAVEVDPAELPEGPTAELASGLRGEIAGWRDGERAWVNVHVDDLGAWLASRRR